VLYTSSMRSAAPPYDSIISKRVDNTLCPAMVPARVSFFGRIRTLDGRIFCNTHAQCI
jgi:hypothetical protein